MGFGLSPTELMIVGVVALLLFGKRLPEVAKSLGKSYREFRSGLSEFHSQVDLSSTESYGSTSSSRTSVPRDYDDYEEPTAPKFDPPPMEPTVSSASPGNTGTTEGSASASETK